MTGGTGFIASHCVEAALDKAYAGTCFTRVRVRKEAFEWLADWDILVMLRVTRLVLRPPRPRFQSALQ